MFFSVTCQSPVDITPADVDLDQQLLEHPLEIAYVIERSRDIVNTGNTVRVAFHSGQSSKFITTVVRSINTISLG